MPQLGKAYIEVRADLSKFPAELKRQLNAAFKEGVSGVDMSGLDDKAAKAGESAAHKASDSFSKRAKGDFKKVGEDAGKSLGTGLFGSIRRLFSRSGGDRDVAAEGVRGIFSSVQSAIGNGIQSIQSGLGQAGGALSGIFGGGGDITSGLKVGLIAAAVPAVFGLAGALVHLSGILLALPAAAGVAGSAIGALVIGFQGFGDAVSAGLSGDTEKFNQALKNLAPSARSVVKEFVGFKDQFSALRKTVQQSLFAPLVGEIRPLLKDLLPVLKTGLSGVAGAFGRFFAGFADLLHANDILVVFKNLFASTARIIDGIAPSILNLFGTLFGVMEHGLPFVEKIFAGLGGGIQSFSDWLSKIVENGKFDTFLQNAIDIGGQLIDTVKAIGPLIGSIFGGQNVKEGSQGFLKDIQTAIEDLTTFFKSDDGKKFIAAMVQAVKFLGEGIILAVHAFAGLIQAANDVVEWVLNAWHSIGDFFSGVGNGISGAVDSIGEFFSGLIDSIGGFFTETLPGIFESVVGFFTSLPDRIFEAIGQVIGVILGLPYFIGQAWDAVVGFFESLPGRLSSALSSLVDIVGGWFSSAFEAAKSFVLSGIDSIENFFKSIPDKIRAIGPALLDAARGLGHKIGDGLSEIGNFASDIGNKIVSTIKSGINRIVDGINRGIADIDDKIPISLPRLPHFEKGGIVDSPTVALLGEKGKREVVVPLTNPRRAQELADQSGLTDMLAKPGGGTTVNLTAYLDGYGVMQVTRLVVNDALETQGTELAYGPRS
jgi:phage-related protein